MSKPRCQTYSGIKFFQDFKLFTHFNEHPATKLSAKEVVIVGDYNGLGHVWRILVMTDYNYRIVCETHNARLSVILAKQIQNDVEDFMSIKLYPLLNDKKTKKLQAMGNYPCS